MDKSIGQTYKVIKKDQIPKKTLSKEQLMLKWHEEEADIKRRFNEVLATAKKKFENLIVQAVED